MNKEIPSTIYDYTKICKLRERPNGSDMNKVTTDERQEENRNGKRHINVNIGLLAGLFGGAILGVFIGAVAHDIPLYTGFGMLLGMAIPPCDV